MTNLHTFKNHKAHKRGEAIVRKKKNVKWQNKGLTFPLFAYSIFELIE